MDISFLLAILSLFLGTLSLFLAVKTARKLYKKKKERNAYWKEHLEIEEIQRLTRPRTIALSRTHLRNLPFLRHHARP